MTDEEYKSMIEDEMGNPGCVVILLAFGFAVIVAGGILGFVLLLSLIK